MDPGTGPARGEARLERAREAELLAAARRGNRASFDALIAEHAPRLRNHMLGLTGRIDDAEDLAQEACVRAFAALGSFDERSAFATWFYAIGRHVSLDWMRRRKVRRREHAGGLDEIAERPGAADPPFARLLALESRAALEAALARLSERHRRVLLLRCVEGRSCGEIAAALGVSANAVSIMIYRAKSELREELLREGEDGLEEARA
jgi:RNA polymerase sigma-70 factor (ECF subfamily)